MNIEKLRNELAEIKRHTNAFFTELDTQLTTLRNSLNTPPYQNVNVEEIINKVSDRQRRRLNVIILSVNEHPVEMDKDTRSQEDAFAVSAIITLIKLKSYS